TIRSTILIPAECATVTTSSKEILKEAEVHHENFKVALHPNIPDQEVAIGWTLSAKGRTKLCSLLKENLDIFAWQPSDMTGVPPEHRLNIREGYSPVRQKKRGQASERAKAIQSEVQKLVEAGITREVYYHDWLSNPVKVKKHDGSWRMCVDFTDLNKACYHQIQMAESDEENTAFHTSHRVYCYTKMPFGLKNAGATYQRLVDKAFANQVGRNIEVLEGIKPCPDKTEVVMRLPSPRTIKKVQSLNGKLASLNRFLSKSAEKSLPLFKTLKKCIKKSNFDWTPEAEQAFKQLKQHLSELPILVAPKPKEELIVYMPASHGAISAVLMTERGTVQMTVYFVSRALQGPELHYTPMEKLVLALVFVAKSVMLGEHNITYRPRTSVKGQILADFLVEKSNEASPDTSVVETPQDPWILFTDESSCVDGSGAGLILTSPEGMEFTYALSPAKEENMIKYLEKAKSLVSGFANFSISQVPRSKNKKADALSKITSTSFAHLSKQDLVEVLKEKSIQEREVATVVEEDRPTWMTPIMEYLKDGTLPDDRKEASKLRIKARQYELLEGVLYRRSFLKPWLRYVGPLQADYVLCEIHEGSCSMHAGPWFMVAKAMRLGYYWPTMHRDARDMIRKCNDCQIHCPVPRNPQQPLTPITAPWLFYKWGIDIAGPFPERPGKSNGLLERANRSLGKGIKARLGEGNKNWIEEIPYVLWAHRTMIKSSHGDTPFFLTYGTEAVIPTEIGMPTYRTTVVDVVHNDEELRLNMDLLEERRERAAIREAKAKLKMTMYYNARVRGVTFRPGDIVYRSNEASHAVDGGKLGPKWERPYEVTEALGDGAYRLRSMDETVLLRTWNIANLKKCYL
ncbi:reverse transcriptase domain-containing protein, partial [Tanacetum coccineum]